MSVKLRDEKMVLYVGVLVPESVPGFRQARTVFTLGRAEVYEDVFRVVQDDVLESLADQCVDAPVLCFGDWLALEMRLESSRKVLLGPCGDSACIELFALVVWIFDVFIEVVNDEGRPLGLGEIEDFANVAVFDGVDPGEIDSRLVFGGDGRYAADDSACIIARGVDKKIGQRQMASGIYIVIVDIEFAKGRNRELFNPGDDAFLCQRSDRVRGLCLNLARRSINDNGRRGDAGGFDNACVGRHGKRVVAAREFASGRSKFGGSGLGSVIEIGHDGGFARFREHFM